MYNKITIEFDPAKSLKNEKERGLPFNLVMDLDWDNALIAQDERHEKEKRYIALTPLGDRLYVVCYTWRGRKRRIISFRKANKREEKIYDEIYK